MRDEAATAAGEARTRPRVLLLVNPTTYRADAFLAAAGRLGFDVVQAHDLPDELAERWRGEVAVDFAQAETAADRIAA
ncbi:MAG TPA: hypothetical protein VFU81_01995, partial [Thermomicrobiales bacterium]|nr:hypothetical protein [Thermomicrobiales bacterium]